MTKRRQITFVVNERGCHICTSHKPNTHGYPTLREKVTSGRGRQNHMHRVLYEEAYGPLEDGILVRHTCDDRMCINLSHMVPGTHAQNTNDVRERERFNPPIGERSGWAKLTGKQVLEIRASKGVSQRALAKLYGVSPPTISEIISGATWAHLEGHNGD